MKALKNDKNSIEISIIIMWRWDPELTKTITHETRNTYIIGQKLLGETQTLTNTVTILSSKIIDVDIVDPLFIQKKFTKQEAICYFNIFRTSKFIRDTDRTRSYAVTKKLDTTINRACDICGFTRGPAWPLYKMKCHNLFICRFCTNCTTNATHYIARDKKSIFIRYKNNVFQENIDVAFVRTEPKIQIVFLYNRTYEVEKFSYKRLISLKNNRLAKRKPLCLACDKFERCYACYCEFCKLQCYIVSGLDKMFLLSHSNYMTDKDVYVNILYAYFCVIDYNVPFNIVFDVMNT
jgi:hypothetical protein